MKEIQLTQGFVTIVDDSDFEELNQYKWHVDRNPSGLMYAVRNLPRAGGKQKQERMHCRIAGGKDYDHADTNGLNNQRYNLRPATKSQNQANVPKHKRGTPTSQYKGVSKLNDCNRWVAKIAIAGKRIYLGIFDSEIKAAKAYDVAAIEHFGQFALTNFI